MTSSISQCFLTFFIVFQKTALFINLENYFSKSFFFWDLCWYPNMVLKFWWNLITVWTFFKINPWLNVCLKFLMWITFSVNHVNHVNVITSFSTFPISILSGKNGKSLWSSCNFLRYWTSTSRKNPYSLSSFNFLWNLHWIECIFHSLKIIYCKLLWHCPVV